MASVHLCSVYCYLLAFVCCFVGIKGENVDQSIGGLVAAAGVAFIFLAIIVAMIIVGFTWNNWYPALQRAKGKVKMPREYWKKKEEAKMRLINGSTRAPSEGDLPNPLPATRTQDTAMNPASWINGWNNANPPTADNNHYEEMALAIDLEEEDKEDDFKIETTVMDNEPLDQRPIKKTTDIVPNPVIIVPAAGKHVSSGKPSNGEKPGSGHLTATMEMTEEADDDEKIHLYSAVRRSPGSEREEAVTSFSKLDPVLVAL